MPSPIRIFPLLRKGLLAFLYYSGIAFSLRCLLQRTRVTIITLHDPYAEVASRQLAWLKRHYHIISLDTLVNAMLSESMQQLPPRSLVITFDDGHLGNFELLPLFLKHQVPATIFLCGALVNTNRHFWFRYPHLRHSSDYYKKLSNQQRLRELEEIGFSQYQEYHFPQALRRHQIDEMKACIQFQSHTLYHPCLPRCTDEECWQEIAESRNVLEEEFEMPVTAIAYPNGDYGEREMNLAKEAGYRCALTMQCGYNTQHTDLFQLKRISIGDRDGIPELAAKASGAWCLTRRMFKFLTFTF